MERVYTLTIKVTGDGTPEKAAELIARIVDRIKVDGEASLGNLQATVTVTEK